MALFMQNCMCWQASQNMRYAHLQHCQILKDRSTTAYFLVWVGYKLEEQSWSYRNQTLKECLIKVIQSILDVKDCNWNLNPVTFHALTLDFTNVSHDLHEPVDFAKLSLNWRHFQFPLFWALSCPCQLCLNSYSLNDDRATVQVELKLI